MRTILAKAFRIIFKIPYFRKHFFGFHKRIFSPLNLFKDVTQKVKIYNNIFFILHIDDWIQENLYFLGEYERAELKILNKFLINGSVFIDLGANIGLFTLHAASLVGENGSIICFEPFSKNFKILNQRI
mgnify:CR=1 FL=1|tara:strand:+ start:8670 stop:9056 length:387 start_codon:yes stop_codon:yes gene_type:complete